MKRMSQGFACGVVMLWLAGVAASVMVGGGQKQNIEPTTETLVAEQAGYRIGVLQGDGANQLGLEEYLVGVLLGELPGSFHAEAKKALAVAARTFTVKMASQGVKHGKGVVCADASCCQAYMSEDDFLAAGGDIATVEQAKEAVQATKGMVLLYQGNVIDATYFSCSGGRTEDAVAVWGTDVPYLQAVDSPGEEDARYHTDTVRFTAEAFQGMLGTQLPGAPSAWFGEVTRTDGGGVETIVIGGESYSGIQLRDLLELRSSSFTVTPLSDAVLITTRGYGHRVGLSQYGADAMGRQGSSWQQILAHYYQGTEVAQMESMGEIGG